MPKVYLDHSATTPVRPEVARLVMEYMTEKFGNPSTLYFYGREAKKAVEKAREQVAALIKADSEEIIFTSGGTEGDNLAILGIARAYAENGQHIITSAVEHHAVLEACRSLEQQGFRLTVLPVDEDGRVSVAELEKALSPDTILISIMHVNNEVGTIQPVEEIGKLARQRGVILHIDGVQSVGKVPVDIGALQADLLTGSGHKIYGPKGTGFLYLRKGIKLAPLVWGGGQEKAYRPGTENVAGIVGLGLAAELAGQELHTEMPRLATLRNMLIKGLQENIPDTKLNGPQVGRVPTNVNLRFAGVEGEALLQALDLKGICASSGSACSAGAVNPSHVLLAMGLSRAEAKSSLRMTLGRDNTEEQVAYVLEQLPPLIERLRRK
ncbi:MAG: cysteine desulfurase family protein [Peptococcia bacterium]